MVERLTISEKVRSLVFFGGLAVLFAAVFSLLGVAIACHRSKAVLVILRHAFKTF